VAPYADKIWREAIMHLLTAVPVGVDAAPAAAASFWRILLEERFLPGAWVRATEYGTLFVSSSSNTPVPIKESWPNHTSDMFDEFEACLRSAFERALSESSRLEVRLEIDHHYFDDMLKQCARQAGFKDGIIAWRDHTTTIITKRSVAVLTELVPPWEIESPQIIWKRPKWWKRKK
jgi:hypothetical protein